MNLEQLFEDILLERNLKCLFEQVLREEHLREMSELDPISTGNIIMNNIFNLYHKLKNDISFLVKRAINDLVDRGRPLRFKMTDNSLVTNENIEKFADATVAHCDGLANKNSSENIKTTNKKGFDPLQNYTYMPEFENEIKPNIKDKIISLFRNNFNRLS